MGAVDRFKYNPFFSVFGEAYDERRRQAHFPTWRCKTLKTLQMYVRQKILFPANMELDAQQWLVLKCLVGGSEQEPHHDFPAFEITRARASKETIQAGLMVGLTPDAHIVVFSKCFGEADILKSSAQGRPRRCRDLQKRRCPRWSAIRSDQIPDLNYAHYERGGMEKQCDGGGLVQDIQVQVLRFLGEDGSKGV